MCRMRGTRYAHFHILPTVFSVCDRQGARFSHHVVSIYDTAFSVASTAPVRRLRPTGCNIIVSTSRLGKAVTLARQTIRPYVPERGGIVGYFLGKVADARSALEWTQVNIVHIQTLDMICSFEGGPFNVLPRTKHGCVSPFFSPRFPLLAEMAVSKEKKSFGRTVPSSDLLFAPPWIAITQDPELRSFIIILFVRN
jgi:hypothetical protein